MMHAIFYMHQIRGTCAGISTCDCIDRKDCTEKLKKEFGYENSCVQKW